ncbi:hypothetical protein P4233_11210 [Pseudomonas aeruginosa]|nr:hypothetical protein [Pseudomonas aeruginosa]
MEHVGRIDHQVKIRASASNWARSRRACWSIRRFALLVLALDSPSGKQLAGQACASAVAEQDEDAQGGRCATR